MRLKTWAASFLLIATTAASGAANAQAAPAGDPAVGKKLFIQCRACHTVEANGKHMVGPNLQKVMGAKAGAKAGFNYSPALQKANVTWDDANMDAWLKRPSALVPGNKMVFAGMANPAARANMIAYLKTLK